MRKFGALDGAMENLGPFDDATGKLETLNKAVGKLRGWMTWWRKREIGPFMTQWNILGPFDDAMGKLETLAMGKMAPHDLMGEIGGPRPRILFKRFSTTPLRSFKLMGPKF